MPIQDVLKAIDEEIENLEQVRRLLSGDSPPEPASKRRGRPKGSTNRPGTGGVVTKKTKGRILSAEGKARVGAAQKARGAAQKKGATPPEKFTNKSTAASVKTTAKTVSEKAPTKKTAAKKIVAAKKTSPPTSKVEVSPTDATGA